jgi:Leucine-rich repeat (LRR) protein
MNIILIDEIVQFPYIMSLDASRNVLESLAPLSDLLALTQLDARWAYLHSYFAHTS